MPPKKHRKQRAESAPNYEMAAAISRELPNVLLKEGYLKTEIIQRPVVQPLKQETAPVKIAEQTYEKNSVAVPQKPIFTPRGDRKILWYMVAFFTVLVFALWLFNTKTLISAMWGQNSSQELIDQSKNDLQAILETIKENDRIFQERLNTPTPEESLRRALTSIR